MGLANCPECGKLYVENSLKLCPDCCKEYDVQVEKVLNYLRTVSNATVKQISEETGVKAKIILSLLSKGLLTNSNCQIAYPCENCGKPIEQGRVCKDCSKKITGADPEYKAPEVKFSQKSSSKWYAN